MKRVLLDESVPRHLAASLDAAGFSARAYSNDWKQTKNGELLSLAEQQGFEVLITSDQSLFSQQNLRGRKIAIIALPTNLRRHIMQRASDVADTIRRIEPAQYVVIERSGTRRVIDYNTDKTTEMPAVPPFTPE